MINYIPTGVCAKEIQFDIENNKIKNVKFIGGCAGNLQAIGILIDGMSIDEVIKKFKGNLCRNGTSCTDQLAQALEKSKQEYK